jgi:hypothetical protein
VPRPTFIAPIFSASLRANSSATLLATWNRLGRARLADVAHLGDHRALDGLVDVGVLEHDERGVAAELHRQPQEIVGGLLHQRATDLGRPGERQLAEPLVLDQRRHRPAGRRRGDEVQHAAWQPGLLEDLAEHQHRQWCQLCGLDDHRAPGRDRRPDLPRAHREREVPRRDQQARSDRLAHRQQPALAVRRLREPPVDPHRLLGEPAQELGGVEDLGLRLRDRLAHLERHQQRELVLALDDRLERAAEDLAAIARWRLGPARPRRDRGVEGLHRLLRRCVRHVGDRFAGGRILDPERAARGIAPLAADVQLLGDLFDYPMFVCCCDRAHRCTLPGRVGCDP